MRLILDRGQAAMSHYDVLGIPFDADEGAIRSAYKRLARKYHPDAGEGASVERFRQIVEAYETLSDAGNRRDYDLSLRSAHQKVVPVEPMATRPRPFVRRAEARTRIVFGSPGRLDWDRLDDLFGEVLRSLDDFLAPPPFWW
jgi:curved DNA-binding protein CbpA